MPSVAQIKLKAPTLFVPSLEYLTVQEFEAIPELMKDANPLDCPSEEDSDDATDFNLNVSSLRWLSS